MMKQTVQRTRPGATERESLTKRVKDFYRRFNEADWHGCYALIDPQLTKQGKVKLDRYAELMQNFKDAYGSVTHWQPRVSLHLHGAPKQRDKRAFAYVYVVWQDEAHRFHMFRERWIKDRGRWFTRVAGLVPNTQGMDSMRD